MEAGPTSYQPPVDRLLRVGDPRAPEERPPACWRDYRALGLGEADVPELIRLATDGSLHDAPSGQDAVWAPLHAWRALAQLQATDAVGPLLRLANFLDRQGDDWFLEDFPEVFVRIGPPAVAPLAEFLASAANEKFARIMAAHSLSNIAQRHPGAREPVVAHLIGQLARFAENDEELNAYIIDFLLPLNAVEATEVIERAYAAGRVDEGVFGTWDDVRRELGVAGLGLVTKDSPRNPNSLRDLLRSMPRPSGAGGYANIARAQRRERRKRRRRRR